VDWKDAQPDADSRRLDLRFSPTTNGFLFGAEPAFPFAVVDLGRVLRASSFGWDGEADKGLFHRQNDAPGCFLGWQ